MTTCRYCGQDMTGVSCEPMALSVLVDDGPRQVLGRAPFGAFIDIAAPAFCHDCAAPMGGFHHADCVLDLCVHLAQVGVNGCDEGCKVVSR